MLDGSSIDIFAMPYFVDCDSTGGIVYFVDHAIVPLTDTIPVIEPSEFLRAIGPRVCGECLDLPDDASAVSLRPNSLKLLCS